ncbi:CDP-glycerol glycerophosphotransferase family protein [Clostridium botulinum]|uniref:CDP-glycerol glycerophosphotransferase family protein n=1 Tax=Clostridium botulinum TaxID=1491 RepID=A0A6M0STI6_CLOBO|nr:CDP-glycerol glycerophosphotransferase family protein [Clostridium botulinum]
MKSVIKQTIIKIYYIIFYITPINRKTIIFESSVGRNYTGNPKSIFEEMIKQNLDKVYNCVWILEDTSQFIPGSCKKVKRQRFKYFYYMSIAKFWIMDSRQPSYLKKKKSNIYIQTWHGTPLKKLGLDMTFVNMGGHKNIDEYKIIFKQNSSRWDYLISQNSYSTEIFKHAFAFNKTMLEIGYPRNDILFNYDSIILDKLRKKLNISEEKKIILYAPTWRDNQYNKEGKYKFIVPINLEKFVEKFKDEYVLILKPHYLVADKIDVSKYSENVKVCGINYDIQELYLLSDILITDYSSVMFDYSILKKPIIFYMYDLEEYENEIREFYFDILEEAPGEIVLNNEELMKSIEHVYDIFGKHSDKYDRFCKKYNSKDVGNASKDIIKIIQEG